MNKKPQIPMPAHPHKRREALPWQQPKTTEEDPEALRRVQAIRIAAAIVVPTMTLSFLHKMACAVCACRSIISSPSCR